MEASRRFLRSLGVAGGDDYGLTSSQERFPDGASYRFEVPGIQGPETMEALLEETERRGLTIHRVTQTKGIMALTDDEITSMVGIAQDSTLELVLAVGPRATTDTSASVNTPEGRRMGYRLRGQEQVVRALEDVKRGARLGCRTFLVYDEGCLWMLDQARRSGEIPADSRFKVSAHCGHGNACSARVLQDMGADSLNPVRDIQLQMLAAIRQSIVIPLDIHTENPASTGGFIRHYEVPEIVRIAAPVYLKTGGSVARTHTWETTISEARARAKQVELVRRVILHYSETD